MQSTERIARDVSVLQSNLRTFSRLASSLQNAEVRNFSQEDAVYAEIDLLRSALGYGAGETA